MLRRPTGGEESLLIPSIRSRRIDSTELSMGGIRYSARGDERLEQTMSHLGIRRQLAEGVKVVCPRILEVCQV
jgi:hypothetical protein